MRANDPRLLALGLALSAVIGGIVAWGRVRAVHVPTVGTWADVPVVCPGQGVPDDALRQAVAWWDQRGRPIEVGCSDWSVSLDVDPTLDERASVDDVSLTHGMTALHADGQTIVAAEIRILPGSDALVIAHELGHAFGLLHPRAAPTGHILHPHRPGWDGRGVAP